MYVNQYYTVHPKLLYCLNIWGFTYNVHLSKVFVNQKKLVRIIADVHFREHTSPIFNILQLFKLSSCFLYMCSLFVYKVLMNSMDNEFFQYQKAMYITRKYSSRNLLIPFVRASSSRDFICYTGPKYWNSLHERVKSAWS